MNHPIKVLHVLGGLDRGGAETLVMNVYRCIDQTKIQFGFVIHTEENGAYFDEIRSLGGEVFHCPKYVGKNHFQYKKWWKDFFKSHPEYSVVHGHVRSTAAIYLKIARHYHRFAVAHSHSTSSGKGFAGFIKSVMQYPIRFNADFFMGCSEQANKWLFGKKVAKDKTRCIVLKNGIDLSKYRYDTTVRNRIREELRIENRIVFGTVGRIEEPKNPFFILKVFEAALKKQPDALFLWIGDGSLSASVKKTIEENGLNESVIMLGSRSNVSDYLQAMDLFLFPSLWEGLGMSLIEAQATGLPCVCSTEIQHEAFVTDLICSVSLDLDADSWADMCLSMICTERANQTQRIIEAQYDIRQVVGQLEKVYLRSE